MGCMKEELSIYFDVCLIALLNLTRTRTGVMIQFYLLYRKECVLINIPMTS
jgi:hypothetical protein